MVFLVTKCISVSLVKKAGISSAAEYSEADAQVCQARIAELESRLLEKQEAVDRLTEQMDELQDQLTQHNDSMQLQVCSTELANGIRAPYFHPKNISASGLKNLLFCGEKCSTLLTHSAKSSILFQNI